MSEKNIRLKANETLRREDFRNEGHQGQSEVTYYSVIDSIGNVVGNVKCVEHTSTKSPFRTTVHITQHRSGELFQDEIFSD